MRPHMRPSRVLGRVSDKQEKKGLRSSSGETRSLSRIPGIDPEPHHGGKAMGRGMMRFETIHSPEPMLCRPRISSRHRTR